MLQSFHDYILYPNYFGICDDNVKKLEEKGITIGEAIDRLVAIEEGATMVRVGTGIFGERNYNK